MLFHPSTVHTRIDTPLGAMVLSASEAGLNGAWFDGQRHQPTSDAWPQATRHPVLLAAQEQLLAYFAGAREHFALPLDLSGGTAFQRAVWQALLAIAPGATCSYGALAHQLARPAAVRAVGAAVGRNPISVIVPCHRVLGHAGGLTGYAGGLPRKSALLQRESALPELAAWAPPGRPKVPGTAARSAEVLQ
ncbi:methylated-DNA--[protein]-cysteine S-methyltransferase [Pseudorhodoferax soli]|uniref:Methylated-DNA--protein-cysteine methyltransferase n=1 Tax=Pseudorhodoferax soli TaxID=545864 RepID=A0A368XRB7_9BURK|nr:methylated-DNA--[protein]-cysteine S-methyltransferase [Pseudorhodoferax soli]RCW70425.1 methylated-DNA-[protein]-cysteine S-methyltransferase [Pseudorhodoferax soli]